MSFLIQIITWLKLGWPIAKTIINVLADGKITKEELKEAIGISVDSLLDEKGEIKLWGEKAKITNEVHVRPASENNALDALKKVRENIIYGG